MKLKQDKMGIGHNLKHLREQSGFSQAQFTRELQLLGIRITCDIYKKMEQNRYNIRIYELLAMKHVLNVHFDDFFVGLTMDNITNISD